MEREKALLFLISFFIISFPVATRTAFAIKHVNGRHTKEWKWRHQGLWSGLKYWWSNSFGAFTMVGGKLCSTYPDETGTVSDYYHIECPSRLSGGCAVDIYDADWNFIMEKTLSPGSWCYAETQGWKTRHYEIYYCNEDCTCTDYESQGCGVGSCTSDEMLRTRSCKQDCAEEEVCVEGYGRCGCDIKRYCSNGDVYKQYQDCSTSKVETCGTNEECANGECVTAAKPKGSTTLQFLEAIMAKLARIFGG